MTCEKIPFKRERLTKEQKAKGLKESITFPTSPAIGSDDIIILTHQETMEKQTGRVKTKTLKVCVTKGNEKKKDSPVTRLVKYTHTFNGGGIQLEEE